MVSPSREWLAQPSTKVVLSALLEPGSVSRFAGADQLSQFFAATTLALASAIRLTAPTVRRLAFGNLCMTTSAHVQVTERAWNPASRCAMKVCR